MTPRSRPAGHGTQRPGTWPWCWARHASPSRRRAPGRCPGDKARAPRQNKARTMLQGEHRAATDSASRRRPLRPAPEHAGRQCVGGTACPCLGRAAPGWRRSARRRRHRTGSSAIAGTPCRPDAGTYLFLRPSVQAMPRPMLRHPRRHLAVRPTRRNWGWLWPSEHLSTPHMSSTHPRTKHHEGTSM